MSTYSSLIKEIEVVSAADQEISKVKRGIYENAWDESVNNYKIFQIELCFQGDIALRGRGEGICKKHGQAK